MNEVNYKTGLGFLLSTLGRKAEYLWNAFLQAHDISTAEFTALSFLYTRGEYIQKQLASDIEVDPRNIVATVAKLQGRGWVESQASHQDGRAKIIRITQPGRDVVQTMYTHLRPIDENFFQNLTPSEKAQLQRLLGKLKYGSAIQIP
jgi:DNA-binding MarR family transcriptional regulator